MGKQYRSWAPEQSFLLPPSPLEWLPEGHLAFFILEVVGELDLEAIESKLQSKDWRGERPYSPRMMTGLILYGYCTGVFSSRKIERGTYEDVPLRVLSGGSHPHFTTVNEFRLAHREALAELFVQVLQLCVRAGLKTLGHVSLDGSKVQANASKHKAMSYGRMKSEEKRLTEEVTALLARADEVDAAEDAEFGAGKGGDEVAEELRFRETRRTRIREMMAELKQEALEARAQELHANAATLEKKAEDSDVPQHERRAAITRAKAARKQADEIAPRKDDDDDAGGGGASTQLSLHHLAVTAKGEPTDKAQRNFTDSDSRIMIRNRVFLQAYNAQAIVSEDQLIVATGVTNNPTDVEQLAPMLERVRQNCGQMPTELTADSGYLSEANVGHCDRVGVDAYIATKGDGKAPFPPTTPAERMRLLMRLKLGSSRGKELYAKRKVIVEPVFGQIKAAMGFRGFSLRGLGKVACEWGIVTTCHNLLKLFRAGGIAKLALATA